MPDYPAYVPSVWLRYSDSMSFGERLYNSVIAAAELIVSEVVFQSMDQEMLDDLYTYPGHRNCPPLDVLRKSVQLTLVNGHYSVSYARPYPPNVVQVAGMHMQPQTSTTVDLVSCTCTSADISSVLDDSINYFATTAGFKNYFMTFYFHFICLIILILINH